MQAPAAAAVPYRLGSRKIVEHVRTQAWAASTRLDFTLRKSGYLAGLLVRLTGTVTVVTGSPDERPGFPYNILQRLNLNVPGLATPLSQSGYMAKMQMLIARAVAQQHGFARVASAEPGQANAFHDSDLDDRAPIAVATNDWDLWWYLPIEHNERDTRGMIPLGGEADVVLEVTCAALADIFDTTANVSATALNVELYQVIRTAPVAGVEAPDTSWAIVYDQYEQSVAAVGDVDIEIPRDGTILNIIHALWFDDDLFPPAPEANVETVSLRVNRDKLYDAVPFAAVAKLQAMGLPVPLPAGIVAFDFDALQADIPYSDAGHERIPGWLYTQGVTEIESRLRVGTGQTLDNAKVITSVKRLMRV